MAGVMGGPSKEQARRIIRDLTGEEPNRARHKSSVRSRVGRRALTRGTAVATLADLGVPFDPEAFYSVKGGKLIARHRRAGRGLGKATVLGSLPGYRRGTFYSVKRGVVYARQRT
jgi:hypothetical protein